jgi:hypothetical protein
VGISPLFEGTPRAVPDNESEDLHMIRLRALENIEKNKMRVAKYYNKKVKVKQFAERDLVWKALPLIGTKYNTFGK